MHARAIAIAAVLFVAARSARAEVWPARLVLREGGVVVAGTAEVNLAPRRVGRPFAIAPDAWWGATRELTLGVTSSSVALDRIEPRGGLCLHDCEERYANAAVDVRWQPDALVGRVVEAAARARLVMRTFDPARPSLRVGVLARARLAPAWAVETDPQVQLGLANREAGNREVVDVPVWLRFRLGCRAAGWVRTGVRGEVATFADAYAVPVGVGGVVDVGGGVEVAAEVGLPYLFGPLNEFSTRSATVTVSWAR